jgi:predicted flap endonuclease-1-like 5' DNA nuclease
MRLDYTLYALAIVIFIITALSAVIVIDQTDKSIWIITTAVLGILFVIVGYYVRPQVKAAAASQPAAPMPQEPAPAAPVAEAPKAEPPIVESPKIEVPPMIEAPKVETPAVETEAPAQTMGLTQIRGINEKRAVQLRANGINSVEDLAKASASDLATKLEVSPKIVKMWIGSAKKLVK